MDSRVQRRLFLVWLGLSGITVLQLVMSSLKGQGMLLPSATITVSVIGMALIKARFILREFMEVRHAPALLRHLTDVWIAITSLTLFGVYFLGMILN